MKSLWHLLQCLCGKLEYSKSVRKEYKKGVHNSIKKESIVIDIMSVKTQNTLELSFSTNFEKIASEVKPQIFILFWTVLLPTFTVFAYIHFVKA